MNRTQPPAPDFAEAAAALAAEDPWQALNLLGGLDAGADGPLPAKYWRLLGLAHLSAGQPLEAELPLRRASALGDVEAEVEYGRWLRLCGQVKRAAEHLAAVIKRLPGGELKRRAQIFLSEALFFGGEVEAAMTLCRGLSPALTQPDTPAGRGPRRNRASSLQAASALGRMHLHLGELEQASTRFEQVLAALPAEQRYARVIALGGLAVTQSRQGQTGEAQRRLTEGRRLLAALPRNGECWGRASLLRAELEVRLVSGERSALQADLRGLGRLADQLQNYELRLWTAAQRAELLSGQGRADQALLCLYELGTRQGLPPPLKAVRGVLMHRQRYEEQALEDLLDACREIGPQDRRLFWRTQLFVADLQLGLSQNGQAKGTLRRALLHFGRAEDFRGCTPDFEELRELVQYALIEPELAPLMQAVLARLQAGPALLSRPVHLEVRTLGHVSVIRDGQVLETLLAGAALLLVYIFLHPHQSRNDMQAALFPEFDRFETTTFFRTAVRELRAQLGPAVVQLDDTLRHPRYRLGGGTELILDLEAARLSLNAADIETALNYCHGPFFADLIPESEWAGQVRQEMRLAFNLAFQLRLSRAESAGELRHLERQLTRALAMDTQIADASPALAQALALARQRLGEEGRA